MKHRILLADDSATIRKVVELTFSDEDVAIDSVGDGAQALEHARAQHPDIIISDVVMPGLNGYELCQQVKADPGLQSVPFLFLKGTFESFDEEKALACGADGIIVKPFESQDMIAKVKNLIEKSVRGASPPSVQPRQSDVPPPIPTTYNRQAPGLPTPTAMPARSAPPIPPRPVRPVGGVPHGVPPPPATPPVHVAPPPPPPPPRAEAPAPVDDFGFDFGDSVSESFAAPATQAGIHPAAASPAELPGESDEDLWSEVSLRGNAGDLLEIRAPAASVAGFVEDAPTRAEGAKTVAPDVLFENETLFDEVSTAPAAPPESRAASPEARDEPDGAPAPAQPPSLAAPIAVEQAEIERIVASRVEAAVRRVLEPIVSDLARATIEAVAWEVIPDLAEAMIRAEIERVRQSIRTD